MMRWIHRNKRAIELSINFIVLLILAISMFAGGLVFVGKFFTKAQGIKGTLDSQTERQLEAMLDTGNAFAIPIHSKTVHRKEHATFGVGIYNDGRSNNPSDTFTIEVSLDRKVGKNGGTLTSGSEPKVLPGLTQSTGSPVKKDEKHKFLVLFDIPSDTPSGTYIYNVKSYLGGVDSTEYEPGLQIIVKVA